MPFTPAYRRYKRRSKRARNMGGIRRSFRGHRVMTASRVRRIVDSELKFHDLGVGPIEIPSATGSIISMSNIVQGDAATQRNGNWIKPVTFMGTITIFANPLDAANATVAYRIGCVQWLENQTANAIAISDIMQDTSDPHQNYNVGNKGQFKILWSRVGILSNDPANIRFQAIHKFYVKPSRKILYDGGPGRNNQLFIFAYSQVDTLSDPPSYSFSSRLRFTDS